MSQYLDMSVQINCIYHESLERYEIWKVEEKEVEPGLFLPVWTEHVSQGIPAEVVMDEVELLLEDRNWTKNDIVVLIEANCE